MTANTPAKAALSIRETAEVTGLSVSSVRRALAAGVLRSVKIGRRVVIPRASLDALLAPGTETDKTGTE
ncbi:MAG: helix-turn-helix domain-containing protein [Microthrixaceae bacterium]